MSNSQFCNNDCFSKEVVFSIFRIPNRNDNTNESAEYDGKDVICISIEMSCNLGLINVQLL